MKCGTAETFEKIDAEVDKAMRRAANVITALDPRSETESELTTSQKTTEPSESSINLLTDVLFPRADYYPARQWAAMCQAQMEVQSETVITQPRSIVRKLHERLALEPLEDCKHLKQRGLKARTRPNSEFPSASYKEGHKPKVVVSPTTVGSSLASAQTSAQTNSSSATTSATSTTATTSSSNESKADTTLSTLIGDNPMVFYSKDGKMKMILEPVDGNSSVPEDSFPIVPKQLESNTHCAVETKPERTKIHAKFDEGGINVNILGMFDGPMTRRKMAKLVINGVEYKN